MARSRKRIRIDRTLSQDEFDRFAALSGDDNGIHVDAEFSARTRFGRPVAHGMFLYAILRALLEELVPGARQVSQRLRFTAPTYAGEPMTFSVEIRSDDGEFVTASMSSTRIHDQLVTCEGEAVARRVAGRA